MPVKKHEMDTESEERLIVRPYGKPYKDKLRLSENPSFWQLVKRIIYLLENDQEIRWIIKIIIRGIIMLLPLLWLMSL